MKTRCSACPWQNCGWPFILVAFCQFSITPVYLPLTHHQFLLFRWGKRFIIVKSQAASSRCCRAIAMMLVGAKKDRKWLALFGSLPFWSSHSLTLLLDCTSGSVFFMNILLIWKPCKRLLLSPHKYLWLSVAVSLPSASLVIEVADYCLWVIDGASNAPICCAFYLPSFLDICHIRFMTLELDSSLRFIFPKPYPLQKFSLLYSKDNPSYSFYLKHIQWEWTH